MPRLKKSIKYHKCTIKWLIYLYDLFYFCTVIQIFRICLIVVFEEQTWIHVFNQLSSSPSLVARGLEVAEKLVTQKYSNKLLLFIFLLVSFFFFFEKCSCLVLGIELRNLNYKYIHHIKDLCIFLYIIYIFIFVVASVSI